MLQRALQHISDDFHVAVRVHGEAAAARHAIVIHDAQGAEVHVFRIVVLGKGKREMGAEPAVIGVAAFVAFTDAHHGRLQVSRYQ